MKGFDFMKKFTSYALAVIFNLMLAFCMTACAGNIAKEQPEAETVKETGIWENATYFDDTEIGEGSNTAVVEVTADDRTITFTIHTDKETVGDALLENQLIVGDEGEYGLYVKVVNGMTADYDIDQSYWAFYINGEYSMTGVDGTDITENTVYSLVYTK